MDTNSLNKLSKISTTYPARGNGIFEYVTELTSKPGTNPVIHIASPTTAPLTISDIGLVICNFGDSELRRQLITKH